MKTIQLAGAFTLALLSTAHGQVAPSTPDPNAAAGDAVADSAWTRLSSTLPTRERPVLQGDAPVDWAAVAAEARSFREKFLAHAKAAAAAKIALIAAVRAEDDRSELSAETAAEVRAFLDDKANATRDRLELKITFDQASLSRRTYSARSERLQAHTAHARDLIREFPGEPEGYGYLLAQAKAESPENARLLAGELLASPALELFKEGARRVLRQLDLIGQPLALGGADQAIEAAKGYALVVYTWSMQDDGFLEIVRSLGKIGDTRFIGVNLDADREAAQAMATKLKLPGTQLYDREGLEGPAARQLAIAMTTSLYLVDREGIVRDVHAHRNSRRKLTTLVLDQEGRP